jgi:hypothetical protein
LLAWWWGAYFACAVLNHKHAENRKNNGPLAYTVTALAGNNPLR